MPDLPFILPHWLYWSTLVVFPLLAMVMVRREQQRPQNRKASLVLAYFMWLGGGFVGLHRFYARNLWGIIFIPLFLPILYGNAQQKVARDVESDVRRMVVDAEFDLDDAKARFKQSGEKKDEIKIVEVEKILVQQRQNLTSATEVTNNWHKFSGIVALVIAILLAIDAFLLPGLIRRCAEKERKEPEELKREPFSNSEDELAHSYEGPLIRPHNRFTDFVDFINGWVGEFICYWTVIAIAVYYYEVLARYVFNSPTNWAHESMYLMFGMMYMLGGGFGLRVETHVRVDIFYLRLSEKYKAVFDLVTSVVFFIFMLALLWSGWVFAGYSIGLWEVSFTEWAIQHWVVKLSIVFGSALLLLQGTAKVVKDVLIVSGSKG